MWRGGGTGSGYWANGRSARAPRPRRVTKVLRTTAKRGRSIKKWVRRILLRLSYVLADGGVADVAVLAADLRSRGCERKALYDHSVVGVETGANDPESSARITRLNVLWDDRPIWCDSYTQVAL